MIEKTINLVTPGILDDQPLTETRGLKFQFETYAKTLARIITSRDTITPLTIGIHGEWGSGKTTLLKILKRKLEEIEEDPITSFISRGEEDDFRSCKVVWFNAWKYSKQEEIFVALFEEIVKQMDRDGFIGKIRKKDFMKDELKVAEFLLSASSQILSLGKVDLDLSKFQRESKFRKNMAFYDEFQEAFDKLVASYTGREKDGILVILIDDLDRCLPSKTIQVLEAIKLFMDRPGCIFVLGADINTVATAVEAHYTAEHLERIKGMDYLDKIIQVRFLLPPIRAQDIDEFIMDLPNIGSGIKEYLRLITSGVKTNPRKIKTFLNHFELQCALMMNMGLITTSKDEERLVEWLVLSEISPCLCDKIKQIENDDDKIALISKMKEIAEASEKQREKLVKMEDDEQIKEFAANERLLKVLKEGEFSFTPQNIGLYVHLSRAPSIKIPPTTGGYYDDYVAAEC